MFDRVRIKEMAKTALKRCYWAAVAVAVLVGLLGGSLAGGLTQGQSSSLNLNDVVNVDTDTDLDTDFNYDDDYSDGVWGQPDNPWEDQGGNVWEDHTYDEDQSLAEIWEEFKAEFNAIMEELADEMGFSFHMGLSIFIGVLIAIALIVLLLVSLYTIFVGNVMTVGGHGWMLRQWRGENAGVGEAFASFRIYKPTVVTMLVRDIYVWLWSLLFVIPGVIKAYAYSMTPYIIYENPNISANQAIKMSKKMTDGYKGDLFVLNLSFIGWVLLSAITGGLVGIFWANPYMGLTHAGVYEDLKWKAIQSGKLTWEDFGQTPPPPADPFQNAWGNPAPQQPWGNPAPQQPFWEQPAPQQPWGNPAPQQPFREQPAPPSQPQTENNPTDIRW